LGYYYYPITLLVVKLFFACSNKKILFIFLFIYQDVIKSQYLTLKFNIAIFANRRFVLYRFQIMLIEWML